MFAERAGELNLNNNIKFINFAPQNDLALILTKIKRINNKKMTIVKENIDNLNAILQVRIEKADYEEKVANSLKDIRKKANFKGFRPGNVPIGLIRKMYGLSVKAEEVNKTVLESVFKYLEEEKIEILGEPLPKIDDENKINIEADDDFDFTFEIGLSPAVEIKLSKKNKVTGYKIIVDDEMKQKRADDLARRFGRFVDVESVGSEDMLKGDILQLDENGAVKAEGISALNSTLSVRIVKDDAIKTNFIGKVKGEVVDFDIKKAFPNDYEVAGLLQKKREEIGDIEGNFRFAINEIQRFESAAIDEDLFKMVYNDDSVKTKEEFFAKIEEGLNAEYAEETKYKLHADMKGYITKKVDVQLPEDFLKRWLLRTNDKLNEEQIEKEFDTFAQDLKWQLIRNKVAVDNEMKVEDDEIKNRAAIIAHLRYQQYGYYYVTDEQVAALATEMLKNQEEVKRIAGLILDDKVLDHFATVIKIEEQEISDADYGKLFN